MTSLTKSLNWGWLGELLQLSVKMPLPALQQPSQAEDPNGVERHSSVLSMEGFFPHLSQGSPEVLFYAGKNRHRWWDKKEKVQSDCKEAKDMGYDLEGRAEVKNGRGRKVPLEPHLSEEEREAWLAGRPVRTSISENIGLGYLPTPLPAPKTLSDAESSGDLSFLFQLSINVKQRAKRRE